jgi:hypothetical protein
MQREFPDAPVRQQRHAPRELVMSRCARDFLPALHIDEKNANQGIDANLEREHYI